MESDSLIVTEDEANQRLDKVLIGRFPEYSRTYLQGLIEKSLVLVNGTLYKKATRLESGDEIEIEFFNNPDVDLLPEEIPLEIIYEDEHLLAINKPPGLVVHPGAGNWTGTFVNALLYHCRQKSPDFPTDSVIYPNNMRNWDLGLRPGIVHRLDKETSGVLLAAKDESTQRKLVEAFAERKIYKEYRAICLGNPGSRKIEENIGRHPLRRKEMAIVEHGKQAITLCETLQIFHQLSHVKLIAQTGRTHQLRVHMRHAGFPILGDPVYGNASANKKWNIERQLLHAYKLRFQHPHSQLEIELKAPFPEDFKRFIYYVG